MDYGAHSKFSLETFARVDDLPAEEAGAAAMTAVEIVHNKSRAMSTKFAYLFAIADAAAQ